MKCDTKIVMEEKQKTNKQTNENNKEIVELICEYCIVVAFLLS